MATKARSPGRKTLQGDFGSGRSPQLTVRLPADLFSRLRERAKADGLKVSDVLRIALEKHLR